METDFSVYLLRDGRAAVCLTGMYDTPILVAEAGEFDMLVQRAKLSSDLLNSQGIQSKVWAHTDVPGVAVTAKPAHKPRTVLRVLHRSGHERDWVVKVNGAIIATDSFKQNLVDWACTIGESLRDEGELAQVVISKQDGTIETEYTYGEDPVESVG